MGYCEYDGYVQWYCFIEHGGRRLELPNASVLMEHYNNRTEE